VNKPKPNTNIVGSFLKTIWYPIFLPTCNVNSFKIKGWRVIVINSGQDPAKPLLCRRLSDNKEMNIGYDELLSRFIGEKTFIDMAHHYNYRLSNKDNGEMTFEPFNSKT
jgi:hypothetical protein